MQNKVECYLYFASFMNKQWFESHYCKVRCRNRALFNKINSNFSLPMKIINEKTFSKDRRVKDSIYFNCFCAPTLTFPSTATKAYDTFVCKPGIFHLNKRCQTVLKNIFSGIKFSVCRGGGIACRRISSSWYTDFKWGNKQGESRKNFKTHHIV